MKAIGKGLGSAAIGGGMGAFIGASSATNSFGMGALKEQMGKINKDINSNTLKATTKKDKIGRGISDFGSRIKDYFSILVCSEFVVVVRSGYLYGWFFFSLYMVSVRSYSFSNIFIDYILACDSYFIFSV